MNLSENGLALIELSEGFSAMPYSDAAGFQTIGYGHKVRQGEDFPNGVTLKQGKEILQADAAEAEAAVNELVKVPLNQNQFDALVDFTYNLGRGNLASSHLLSRLNGGNYAAVPDEMQRWVRSGDKIEPGLVTRRKREAALWCGNVNFKEII